MYIPLDLIYNYLGDIIDPDVIIYRFSPHGSKKLEDLGILKFVFKGWKNRNILPFVVAHDQEPLNFEYYNSMYIKENIAAWMHKNLPAHRTSFLKSQELLEYWANFNLAFVGEAGTVASLYDRNIIIHSERRSSQVEKYSQVGLEGVYWWSHAVIARDWYRYANVDPELDRMPGNFPKLFNVYNRAWSGTREYRLKFIDQLIDKDLVKDCLVKFNPVDNDVHYHHHAFVNPDFCPVHELSVLPKNSTTPCYSAGYSAEDYQQCWFDVVLETLFDDHRLHLTEKILRPIACGKPFILASTHGALEYLRSYGFRTFGNVIDESYDLETDPVLRMNKIILTMQHIQQLDAAKQKELALQLNDIVRFNKQRFFSQEFALQLKDEFLQNYQQAKHHCDQHRKGHNWRTFRKIASRTPELKQELLAFNSVYTKQSLIQTLTECHQLQEQPL